ncbi:MAG: circularly permuted type 2 ATP-grasp protein [Desulfatitalea sp.]|nr:circularly permuted type 2 ATP-grasp protein [Desulfatitalea sp.]NNK00829.1 circularly permuted type 2 ATP-grasp protein [Desulfatitalea sp.]
MTDVDAFDPTESRSAPASLFDRVSFPPEVWCESFSSPAIVRNHWRPLLSAMDAMGADLLGKRQARVRRMRHEDGATYNLFDDPSERRTSWALDMVPLPITALEWAELEAGLIQRARLLEQILADVHGPQNLIRDGLLPAEVVFANPNFLRPCHGIQPAGNRYLTYYAADLYRGADGRFRVLRDHGENPAGLGYALENRIVISRVFSDLYHHTQIRRLAPFFQAFHHSLIERASLRQEDPGIVLLSSGPQSSVYFEHALLSRYLGYPLVESQDLTVRNGNVFLKKLAGLEPVAAIFRHLPDSGSDPFALRRQTETGVAGLIQAAREQRIDLVNPIGSGFAGTPVMPVFLPALCLKLMGENLALENHPAWWCGDEDGRHHVLGNMGQLTVAPAMDRSMPIQAADLPGQIRAMPHAFMAREPVRVSVSPGWDPAGAGVRHTILRIFVCATEQGFAVMPGGLAISAPDVDALLGDFPERQQSKDIWVLSDQPVAPFSLMDGLETATIVRRGSDLPSRVADHLLWLGRYLERAEGLIRLVRSVYVRLSGEARLQDMPELSFLLNLLREQNAIPRVSDNASPIPYFRDLWSQLHEVLYRKDTPESVIGLLNRVQAAARNVRDRLSLDCWRTLNRLEDFADISAGDPLDHLEDTLFTLSAFSGLAMESMTRGLGWRFMDMGRRIERAMNQTGLVRIGLHGACAASKSGLEALLEVADSIMTYRARYRTTFQPAPALDLMLMDEDNPKSLAFQLSRLSDHVEHLPRRTDRQFASPEERLVLEMLTSTRLLDLTGLTCGENGITSESLTPFLESMERNLKAFAQHISAHFLSRVPTTPHFSMIPQSKTD